MPSLNFIEAERLKLIPARLHAEHEFCFRLHDLMVSMLLEAERRRVADVTIRFEDEEVAKRTAETGDILDFLLQHGGRDYAKRLVINQVCLALFSDLLHFLYEALRALEKRKFAVAFTLLRKPLRENMMFATWMCADDEDFFQRMERSPAEHMERKDLPKRRKLELLEKAIGNFKISTYCDAQVIHDIVYDKNLETGFAPLFDKAVHLVTSRGALMRTEELNFNFIFKNPLDDDLYESLYCRLSYLLLYLVLLQITLYSRMGEIEESYIHWVMLTSMGAYHSLFCPGRSPLVRTLNRMFGEFLRCPHCGSKVRVTKSSAARFLVSELLLCKHCGMEHQFPLYWLLAKVDWSITDADQG